jgi:death-on-curing protein
MAHGGGGPIDILFPDFQGSPRSSHSMRNLPEFTSPKISAEYTRWADTLGPIDPYEDRYTIGIYEVLHAHFLLIDYFNTIGEGVGGVGPNNMNLLHSALSRQFVQFGGKSKYADRIEICATLMFGLIKNHPFHDANKRTAFLSSILHLQKIGRTPTVTGQEYEDFTVAIAEDDLEK